MSEQRFLLDTQIVLWDLADDPRIRPKHNEVLLGDHQVELCGIRINLV